jgi:hypothetical protein
VVYLLLINLHKSPAERDRLVEIQVRLRSPTPSPTPHGTISTTRRVKRRLWNGNPIALCSGHSSPSKVFHTDNVKARFSSTTTQAALNLPGVGVHCYPYNHGDIMIENTGHEFH